MNTDLHDTLMAIAEDIADAKIVLNGLTALDPPGVKAAAKNLANSVLDSARLNLMKLAVRAVKETENYE